MHRLNHQYQSTKNLALCSTAALTLGALAFLQPFSLTDPAKAGTASGMNSDVCPKNWRLPTHTENQTVAGWGYTSFDQVWWADADGGNNAATPIYPGYYNYSALYYDGASAYWWSSTQGDSAAGYGLLRSGTTLGTNYDGKHFGFSVRCLLSS